MDISFWGYQSTHYRHGVEMCTQRTINQTNSQIVFLKGSSFSISIWNRVTIYLSLSKFMPLSWLNGYLSPLSLSKYLGLEVNYVFTLGLSREIHSTLRKVAGGLLMRKKIGWSRLALDHFLISTCFPKCHPWCSRTFFLTKHFRGKWEMTVGVCYYLIDVSDCVLAKTPQN